MLDKILNMLSDRTVSNLAIKLLLNLQARGVIESDSDSEEYEYLGLVIKLKWLDNKMNWCVHDRLKQGVLHNTETALADARTWIYNLDPNDSTQFD